MKEMIEQLKAESETLDKNTVDEENEILALDENIKSIEI